MVLNGATKLIAISVSVLIGAVSIAVGYGKLLGRTDENAARISQIEERNALIEGNTGRIMELERRVLVLEAQVDVLRTVRVR